MYRALPAGIACVHNAYSLLSRDSADVVAVCRRHNIPFVPFWPLGGALPPGVGDAITRSPRVQDDADVRLVADQLRENVAAGSVRLNPEQTA